ncbi:MAG: hypothetical protein AB7S38_14780 [Vulcanimicrobiota bacterium]
MNVTAANAQNLIFVELDVQRDSIYLAAVQNYGKALSAKSASARLGTKKRDKMRQFVHKYRRPPIGAVGVVRPARKLDEQE